jgi:uncharacterized membrane protein YccC
MRTGAQLHAITGGLEVLALVFLMHAAAFFFWNYGLYAACVTVAVLILVDLQQPFNYSAEGYRLLWTLCGVAIGVVVMFLGGLLAGRADNRPHEQANRSA